MDSCPNMSCTALKSAPPVTKWDAKEWRKVWGDTGFWIFARSARCLMMLNTITRDREVPLLPGQQLPERDHQPVSPQNQG